MFGSFFSKGRVYLDWAAAAPASSDALAAFTRACAVFGNPSSPHAEGRAAKTILEKVRTDIARELSVKADDVIFTSGATEANNIVILGRIYALINEGKKPSEIHVLYLPSAHASVVNTMRVAKHIGVIAETLPVQNGAVDINELKKMLRPETALVSMDFVCGETGTLWNTREVKHELPFHVLLHVDAAQAPFEEDCERTRVGADFLVLDAQKIGGVRGVGVLVAPRAFTLSAVMQGGGQERTLRPGTPSPALAAAFAVALTDAAKQREDFAARAKRARDSFLRAIESIPNVEVNQGKQGVAHILNLSLTGRDTDYLVALLDEAGFAVSTKSACESDSDAGSRAVLALTGDAERAKATLRISWGPTTSESEMDRFSVALRTAVEFLDTHQS